MDAARVLLLLFSIGAQSIQASTEYMIKTMNSRPYYLKADVGDFVHCKLGQSDAHTFQLIKPGLTSSYKDVSFKSTIESNYYLMHYQSDAYLDSFRKDASFRNSASFIARKDHFIRGSTAYESSDSPNNFLACKSGRLQLVRAPRDYKSASFVTVEAIDYDKDEWGPCTKTCGRGKQKNLQRKCLVEGFCAEEWRACNTFPCDEYDSCKPNPCVYGQCSTKRDGYACNCYSSYTGRNCDIEIKNHCRPNPCLNGGTCRATANSYSCSCPSATSGKNCQIKDPCAYKPCRNSGKCYRSGSDFYCQCTEEYTGKTCQERQICKPNPCHNGGVCFVSGNNYYCVCKIGYTGKTCQAKQVCKPNPCLNEGTCYRSGSSFYCVCKSGYTGKICQGVVSNPCKPNPCLNGGTCSASDSTFSCNCRKGYKGKTCETSTGTVGWSDCSAPCGGGTRSRRKQCSEADKSKCPMEYGDCSTQACKDVRCASNQLNRYEDRSKCCNKHGGGCGADARVAKRIFGGKKAAHGQWPWQVGIQHIPSGKVYCGGAIVGDRWIVTAAHCDQKVALTDLQIIAGTIKITKPSSSIKKYGILKFITHPDYTDPKNDIALIQLKTKIKYDTYIKPICLPQSEKIEEDIKCYATGWGISSREDLKTRTPSNDLLQVDLRILPLDACKVGYSKTNFKHVISEKHICAGLLSGGKDTCVGDSGGPLVCQRKKSCAWFIAGITSIGPEDCARGDIPGAFTDVLHFESWLKSQMSRS